MTDRQRAMKSLGGLTPQRLKEVAMRGTSLTEAAEKYNLSNDEFIDNLRTLCPRKVVGQILRLFEKNEKQVINMHKSFKKKTVGADFEEETARVTEVEEVAEVEGAAEVAEVAEVEGAAEAAEVAEVEEVAEVTEAVEVVMSYADISGSIANYEAKICSENIKIGELRARKSRILEELSIIDNSIDELQVKVENDKVEIESLRLVRSRKLVICQLINSPELIMEWNGYYIEVPEEIEIAQEYYMEALKCAPDSYSKADIQILALAKCLESRYRDKFDVEMYC